MEREVEEKVIDVTGVELTPGKPDECKGNGEHIDVHNEPIECCCDECYYFLLCFPEYDEPMEKGDKQGGDY